MSFEAVVVDGRLVEALAGKVAAVGGLHFPGEPYGVPSLEPECPECSSGDDRCWWPCSTAELVFTDAYVEDVLREWRSWARWGQERARRKAKARGWSMFDDLGVSLRRSLIKQRFIADRILVHPGGNADGSVTYEIVNDWHADNDGLG